MLCLKVDPQTRLEDAISELSKYTNKSFKIINKTLQNQMFEVNEKLHASKQRLEDCLNEMARKTETNFENNAEDSNEALENVEKNLKLSLEDITKRLIGLNSHVTFKMMSTRQSLIQHIKNSNMMVIKNFRIMFDKLNIKQSVETNNRQNDQDIHEQLRVLMSKFDQVNKRFDKVENALYVLNKVRMNFILKMVINL